MALLVSILLIVTCLLLVLVILVQNPKGGGLSSTFGGGNAQMLGGVKKTNDFLDKATWTLAIVLVSLVLVINIGGTQAPESNSGESAIDDQIENFSTPVTPVSTPAENQDLGNDLGEDLGEAEE